MPPPPAPLVEPEPVEPEPEPPAIVLPPLGDSDDALRSMIEGLSAHPRLGDVLATEGVARVFVAAVVAIAAGESPRGVIGYLEPEGSFAIADGR